MIAYEQSHERDRFKNGVQWWPASAAIDCRAASDVKEVYLGESVKEDSS